MEKQTIFKTSEKLYEKLRAVKKEAEERIIEFIELTPSKMLNLMIDDEGKYPDEEDYCPDCPNDYKVWTNCYGKYEIIDGWITEVILESNEQGKTLHYKQEDIYDTAYDTDTLDVTTTVAVLERIEQIFEQTFKNNLKK